MLENCKQTVEGSSECKKHIRKSSFYNFIYIFIVFIYISNLITTEKKFERAGSAFRTLLRIRKKKANKKILRFKTEPFPKNRTNLTKKK